MRNILCTGRIYTVKKFYEIPLFLFTNTLRDGKIPFITMYFWMFSREGVFPFVMWERLSCLGTGNFFLSCGYRLENSDTFFYGV